MRIRPSLVLPLTFVCGALAASCGPNDQAQTVSFRLASNSERLSEITFVVSYTGGKFAATDGQCTVSSAAGPRPFKVAEAELIEKDRKRMLPRDESSRTVVLGGADPSTTVTSSTDSSTTTTLLPTTTTLVPTTTLPVTTTTISSPTTTIVGSETCGDRVLDTGEECDDGDRISNDGCDANCQAEFYFLAEDNDLDALTITIRNGLGIPAGSTLAFCKFQGDVAAAEIAISTTFCSLPGGGACTPTTDAVVTMSTTTTTTTTTKSTTTTSGNGDTSTTSTTEE